MIQMITHNWNLDLKNAQFWQKMDFLSKESQKKKIAQLIITNSI